MRQTNPQINPKIQPKNLVIAPRIRPGPRPLPPPLVLREEAGLELVLAFARFGLLPPQNFSRAIIPVRLVREDRVRAAGLGRDLGLGLAFALGFDCPDGYRRSATRGGLRRGESVMLERCSVFVFATQYSGRAALLRGGCQCFSLLIASSN